VSFWDLSLEVDRTAKKEKYKWIDKMKIQIERRNDKYRWTDKPIAQSEGKK
jgi:hypothetical protein